MTDRKEIRIARGIGGSPLPEHELPKLELPKPSRPHRDVEELEPLARQVLENTELIKRFREARGSNNEEATRQVVDDVRDYARTIDPTISHVEATRLILTLVSLIDRE
jgi:hypothetical protein